MALFKCGKNPSQCEEAEVELKAMSKAIRTRKPK